MSLFPCTGNVSFFELYIEVYRYQQIATELHLLFHLHVKLGEAMRFTRMESNPSVFRKKYPTLEGRDVKLLNIFLIDLLYALHLRMRQLCDQGLTYITLFHLQSTHRLSLQLREMVALAFLQKLFFHNGVSQWLILPQLVVNQLHSAVRCKIQSGKQSYCRIPNPLPLTFPLLRCKKQIRMRRYRRQSMDLNTNINPFYFQSFQPLFCTPKIACCCLLNKQKI